MGGAGKRPWVQQRLARAPGPYPLFKAIKILKAIKAPNTPMRVRIARKVLATNRRMWQTREVLIRGRLELVASHVFLYRATTLFEAARVFRERRRDVLVRARNSLGEAP